MDHLLHFFVFFAEVAVIVIALLAVLGFFFHLMSQGKRATKTVEIEHLNERMNDISRLLKEQILEKKELKSDLKAEQKRLKKEAKAIKPRIFVVDFVGDIKASAVESLREEISAILSVGKETDEVVIRLESPGGIVHSYGLAAAQLMRVRERGLKLTVCVDKVAASGGYMMACVANHIVAAPFAVVGSIGVVAQVPNFNRLLRKHQIDYREYTAGDFKRTVSLFGENTPQGVAKFNEQLQDTHVLFKEFIREHRPQLAVDRVATGEHWYGRQALALGLVDELKTSDTYLLDRLPVAEVYKVNYFTKRKLAEKLADAVGQMSAKLWDKALNEASRSEPI